MFDRRKALIFVFLLYLFTFVFTTICTYVLITNLPLENPFIILVFFDIFFATMIFIFSVFMDYYSLLDFYWSISQIFLIYLGFCLNIAVNYKNLGLKYFILMLIIISYGLRLLNHYLKNWNGFNYKDWRVEEYKQKYPNKFIFQINVYFIFYLASNIILAFGKFPLVKYIRFGTPDWNLFNIIGIVIALIGIIIEIRADNQLLKFRMKNKGNFFVIQKGLWRNCRHPNYLGEILYFWGIYVFCLEDISICPFVVLGPFAVNLMIAIGSAPWMEEHLLKTRPDYSRYLMEVKHALIINPFSERFQSL